MDIFNSLKKYFTSTSKEQLNKDWEEVKELNEIEDDTLEYMLERRKLYKQFIKELKHKAFIKHYE